MNKQTNQYHYWWVAVALSLNGIMSSIDFSAVNLAIAPIERDFHIGLATAQWIMIVMQIMPSAFLILAGQLGDRLGKKRLFLLGVILFTLGSFIAGVASSPSVLIVARLLQGMASAIQVPVAIALLFNVFPKEKQGLMDLVIIAR